MSDDKIQPHRDAIDHIDGDILKLLNERAEHARAIGELKGSGVIYRPEREAQVLRRIKEQNPGPLSGETVARLFREVMSACLSLEKPLTIAYLGPQGTFSEAAAVKHFGHAAQLLPLPSFGAAFRAVEAGEADYAVVPVENSAEGAVGRTLDLLAQTPLMICGEVMLRVHQHLLRVGEGGRVGIKTVYSHPQSLGQCQGWLDQYLPGVACVAATSNSEAAQLASEDVSSAAIAGEAAAEAYGLTIVDRNIEDEPNNTTRFVVMSLHDTQPSGRDKTSVILATKNQPGAVYQLLTPLAQRGVSMTRFESRPAKAGLWEYLFFVDIEGHHLEGQVKEALVDLSQTAAFLKVLGSYPVAVI